MRLFGDEAEFDKLAIGQKIQRDQIVARVDRLKLPSYKGFVMPKLTAVQDRDGKVSDVTVSYPLDLTAQMLEYSAATRHLRA